MSETIPIDGYAKVTILIKASVGGGFVYWDLYACDDGGNEWLAEEVLGNTSNWVKTYDVMSQKVRIKIHNAYSNTITVDVAVYLMA